ncbi:MULTISPECIES: Wzt carbohydrate-binding domain-containing protein [unclassified Leptolyngbya]|uniref:Wzt carbohydrate-binding domain-containing protein n=1 Tax=unclassified Leptolyngbya TaxID=2650499 RepID=UPI00168943EE|nr:MULTISPECIES: Wzt carbohydrate-binding domain-containing protein [unclassified Leptolyngbya]MBD1913100.1 Wzt carbohydrate-binding domain-containing protein [Leptolyngbya sp. FACHB-8]MBD2153236.1 Wzt carbohydrate-binding domain-containing protein [Leptolyngbya sp. FACHB-16]
MTEQVLHEPYDQTFFEALRDGSRQSAAVVVPLILDWVQPKQVVDVGCGDGTWLSMFRKHGVTDVLGIDGDYVEPENLQIPVQQFMPWNLTQPLGLDRTFDLAMSLEVAEHLPEASASDFVDSLIRLSDVVLFSAAIPHQGGTHHINEQWPDYWIQQFENRGYIAVDGLRAQLWDHPLVEPWYAQNSFIFVRCECLPNYPKLQALIQSPWAKQPLVHPKIYLYHYQETTDSSSATASNPSPKQTVQHIKILNLTCHPDAAIQTGEGVTLELTYQLQAPIEAAIFSISLSDHKGFIYLDTQLKVEPLPESCEILHRLQLQIDRLDLISGEYFLNAGAFTPDWQYMYDFHWHRYPVTISAPVSQQGILNPPLRWHIP